MIDYINIQRSLRQKIQQNKCENKQNKCENKQNNKCENKQNKETTEEKTKEKEKTKENEKTKEKEKTKENEKTKEKEKYFFPFEQDTLFWCYYILANGDTAYETLNNKNSLVAKQLKIELVSVIRKNKDIVKLYKFDTITNIESNLANDTFLNAKTFLILCAIANLNIIYISKKTYFELLMNDTSEIYIVKEQNQESKYVKKYGYQLGNHEIIDNIRKSFYKLDKIDKPIKAMSAYKVEELVSICERLAINIINTETGKNKTKKDLYESIVQYF
jgi:hypothetical protein